MCNSNAEMLERTSTDGHEAVQLWKCYFLLLFTVRPVKVVYTEKAKTIHCASVIVNIHLKFPFSHLHCMHGMLNTAEFNIQHSKQYIP